MSNLVTKINLRSLFYSAAWNSQSCRAISEKVNCVSLRYLSKNVAESDTLNDEAAKKKKKKDFISLIGIDNTVSYTTLEEATKLSNRRGLKLIKMTDFDKRRKCPVYQLYTGSQYLDEDIKNKKASKAQQTGFKSEKIITFSNKISTHDVESKVKQILKWIQKEHQVRVTISGSGPHDELAEKTFHHIEQIIGNQGRILQKRNSNNDIKFQIVPPKKDKVPEGASCKETKPQEDIHDVALESSKGN